jgi:uncharacterized protein (TIGR00255 family)
MIRSMTGFGAADGEVGGSRVTVELRSVNHRFFNPSLKLPAEFTRWEQDVREALRRRIGRGHVTLTARIDRTAASTLAIDEARFAAYVARLRELKERYALDGPVDVASVLRLPDVISGGDDPTAGGSVAELVAVVDRAVAALGAMREAEGARLATYLEERLSVIEGALARVAERAPERLVEQRDRMRANVRELADGVAVDEQRIAQEIAILADRLDVQEELSRFRSHLTAFRDALRTGEGEGVGKRLGFLLQEMLREANTTGSKGNDSGVVREVLLVKEELERIREQVENLE